MTTLDKAINPNYPENLGGVHYFHNTTINFKESGGGRENKDIDNRGRENRKTH